MYTHDDVRQASSYAYMRQLATGEPATPTGRARRISSSWSRKPGPGPVAVLNTFSDYPSSPPGLAVDRTSLPHASLFDPWCHAVEDPSAGRGLLRRKMRFALAAPPPPVRRRQRAVAMAPWRVTRSTQRSGRPPWRAPGVGRRGLRGVRRGAHRKLSPQISSPSSPLPRAPMVPTPPPFSRARSWSATAWWKTAAMPAPSLAEVSMAEAPWRAAKAATSSSETARAATPPASRSALVPTR
mmetsp:Transcript_11074/g.37700  ORF Transcript_11074/g.37700 Transcript_11074/m.37700 type:complete len:240 (-) Transcript_11074:387-1106(-)